MRSELFTAAFCAGLVLAMGGCSVKNETVENNEEIIEPSTNEDQSGAHTNKDANAKADNSKTDSSGKDSDQSKTGSESGSDSANSTNGSSSSTGKNGTAGTSFDNSIAGNSSSKSIDSSIAGTADFDMALDESNANGEALKNAFAAAGASVSKPQIQKLSNGNVVTSFVVLDEAGTSEVYVTDCAFEKLAGFTYDANNKQDEENGMEAMETAEDDNIAVEVIRNNMANKIM